jgi:hypothetical protein
MDKIFSNSDFSVRCIGAAISVAIGIMGLVCIPPYIWKKIESGKYSEEEGRKRLRNIRIIGCLITLFGLLKIVGIFR